jgi:hypothetical protein
MFNLKLKTPALMGLPPNRHVELPGANGIGQVRSLAKLYGEFATGATTLGLQQATLAGLALLRLQRPRRVDRLPP